MYIYSMVINPDRNLRVAYLDIIQDLGIPVWANKVPVDEPTPPLYVLITTQTKQQTAISKTCWEWLNQITIDIVSVHDTGDSNTEAVENIEQGVINAVESAGFAVLGFSVKSKRIVESRPLNIELPTQSIERRILIYEHWLNNGE